MSDWRGKGIKSCTAAFFLQTHTHTRTTTEFSFYQSGVCSILLSILTLFCLPCSLPYVYLNSPGSEASLESISLIISLAFHNYLFPRACMYVCDYVLGSGYNLVNLKYSLSHNFFAVVVWIWAVLSAFLYYPTINSHNNF